MAKATESTRLDADLLTRAEVERLLQVCSRRAPTGVRNKAMIVLAWRCGLRISEVLALRLKDVDLDGGLVTVQRGKGDRRRTVVSTLVPPPSWRGGSRCAGRLGCLRVLRSSARSTAVRSTPAT
jgi:Phage integrase family